MTDDQKIQALWECIQRDADEVAAEAFTLLRQRAEQAERQDAEHMAARRWLVVRVECAEAENAALLRVLRRYYDAERAQGTDEAWSVGDFSRLLEEVEAVFDTNDNPGAQLLERMRALENEVRLNLNASHARHDYSHPRVEACPDARCVRLRNLLKETP